MIASQRSNVLTLVSLRIRCLAFLVVCTSLLLAGCGGHQDSISIVLAGGSIAAGQTSQLRATDTNSANGSNDVTGLVMWSSTNNAVATVSSSGLLTAIAPGSTSINATFNKSMGSLAVTVGAAVVNTLAISPQTASVLTGGTQQFAAVATYSNGSAGDVTGSVTWSVAPASVATISASGLLHTVAAGSFTVTATSGSVNGTATGTVADPQLTGIAVTPASTNITSGGTQQFTATGTYKDGSTKDVTSSVTWSSSDISTLTITAAGLAKAGSVSTATAVRVGAQLNSFSASAAVNVNPLATVTDLQVRPTSSSIAAGTAEQHTATAFYSDGTQKDVTDQANWDVTPSNLSPSLLKSRSQSAASRSQPRDNSTNSVSVNQSGVDYADEPGAANVQATFGSFQAQSVVLVTSATVKMIAISSPDLLIPVSAVQQFTLTGLFSDGSSQDLSLTANWQSSDTSIATIDNTGMITAVKAGRVTLTANFGGLTTTKVVEILSSDLVSTTIRLPLPVVIPGAWENATVVGTFSDGTTQDLTPLATWSSSDPGVVQVDNTGFIQSLSPGRAQITADVNGISSVVPIVAADTTFVGISILPMSASMALGTSLPLIALGYFADGAQVDISNIVLWTSSDPTVFTVDSTGRAKSGSVGSATITASLVGITSSTMIQVTNATLTGLTLSPTSAQIAAQTHQQYTATGWFSDGSIQDVSNDVLWSVSDSTVASVDNGGTVLGLTPGTVQVTASFAGTTPGSSLSASEPLTVTNATLVSAVISPGNFELPVLVQLPLKLLGNFSDGTTQDLSADATWQTPTPTIAFATTNGVATGVSPGIGTIAAILGNFSSATQVTVTDATLTGIALTPAAPVIRVGGSQLMTATGTFSDGYSQNLYTNAIFNAANPKIVNVAETGLAVGTTIGSTPVTAIYQGIIASTNFQVLSGTLQSIALSPSNPSVTAGSSQQLTATGTYADGTTSDISNQVAWTSLNPAVLSISGNGVATASTVTAATTVTVTATSGTTTTSFTVTVFPASGAAVTMVAITPTNANVTPGATQQFTAIATYADGVTQNVTSSVAWSSSNPTAATINSRGLAVGLATGSAQIVAQIGGVSSSVALTVSPTTSPGATVSAVVVIPTSPSIAAGATQQFTARAIYSDGTLKDVSATATWLSSNVTAATVSSTGLATGVAAGTTNITSTFSGVIGTAMLTVVAGGGGGSGATLSSIAIAPASATIAAGTTRQFTATGTYSDGSTEDLSSFVVWSSSSTATATINSSGLATGVAAGTSTIGAAFSGVTATATLTVTPGTSVTLVSVVITPTSSSVVAGLSQQFTATGTYSDGSTQNLSTSVTWTSSNPAVATVSSTGLVTGVASGTVTITGTTGAFTSMATVIISTPTLTSIAISPSGVSLPAGTAQQLTLTGTFSDGSRQNLNAVATWSSLAPAVATVSSTGLVTAVSQGTAQVSATYSGQVATTTVQITPATLVSLAISPQTASFANGTTQQFTVTGTYSDGTTHDLTSIATYTSSNPSAVSISSTGLATGVSTGTVQISVSANGDTASTQNITVTPATLVSVTITPSNPTFAKGTTQQFTAIGTYSDGTTQDLSTQVVWTSTNPQVATIDANGLATGGTPGTTQITATFNGVTTSTGTVQVTPAVLTALSITPTSAQIAKGTTLQFTAAGTYSDGSTQNLSSTVTWQSSDGTVVSVSASGVATGIGVGSAQVLASFNGQSASTSSFQVTPATLVSIAFSPTNPTVAAGTSAQVTVTGTFSDGSTQNLSSSASYSSSNTAAVTVNNTGLITGVAPGSSTVTVMVNGVTNSFTAVVTSATLASITISPSNPPSFAKGTTEQFTATGTYSDNSTQNLTSTVAWTSSNPAVFTIDAHGRATGVGVGTATLTATYQGQTVTTPQIQVTPAVPASLAITPQAASLIVGSTQQYAATVTLTDATTQDVTASTTWASTAPAVASISSSGLATALTPGSTTITGQYSTISRSTGLTVTPVVAPTLVSITVTPSSASVAKGNSQQFTAIGVYSDASMQNLTTLVTWQSSVPSVATVNTSGLATSIAGGNTQIWATYQGVSGVATLTVSAATLVSLSVTPATVSLAQGTSQQYRAVGTLSDGSTSDLTTSVTWSSSNPSSATINASGFATTTGVGTTNITAQAGAISGTASMTVTSATVVSVQVSPAVVSLPAGGVQQLLVTAIFTDGSSQNVTSSATYLSSSLAVATVDANGKLTATGTGAAIITVSLGSVFTTVPVTITSAVLTSITLSPTTLSLAVGESQQMTATGTFSDGSTQDLTSSVLWSSSAPQVATVSLTGKVTVSQTGIAAITATNGSVSASVSLTGTTAVVTAISISPASVTLAAGQTQQFAATATMSDGTQQTITSSAHWSTSSTAKGTISNIPGTNGLLLSLSAGSFTVTATLNSISGTAAVTVTSAALTSLTVSPSPVSLPAGTTQAMTVTGNYTDGSTADVTSSATWTSNSASVATVDTSSVLHGVSAGSAMVTATVGLISKSDPVTVTSAVLTSIAISLSSDNVPLGLQTQLTATGTYSDGSTQNLTSQVRWSSSTPSVATVSSIGLVSTLAAGSTQLIATLGTVTQQTSLTVTAAVLESMAVQAGQSSFALGLSLQLTAIGTYSDSSTQNITSQVTWSSQTPAVGVVSATGLATGVTTGNFNARATLNGVTGSLAITVSNAVLQTITVTPANTTIVDVLGTTQQYTATGHFSDGSTQNITNSCHWAITSGLAVGSISQTGSFSPLGLGTGTLSATSGSISGSTGLTVVSVL